MIDYFTQANPPFGNISWTMAVVWAAALAFAVYLLRSYRSSNPIRSRFVRQAGIVVAALSVLGIVLLALKLLNVPVLEWRLWSYLVAIASLGYWGYAIYHYNQLPAQVAPTRSSRASGGSGKGNVRVYSASSTPTTPKEPRPPRPVATTTRREARRDRKRKSR